MKLKLSNKAKKIILGLVIVLVAVFVVYSLLKGNQPGEANESSREQLTIVDLDPTRKSETPTEKEDPGIPVLTEAPTAPETGITVQKGKSYTDKEHVALYLHLYGELPPNFITKSQAEALGWVSSKGNLAKVAPGKSIGGDSFSNREGLLPKKSGRKYYECDIDYVSGTRNAKRIVYSNDGLIFYTEDHYATYTQLY